MISAKHEVIVLQMNYDQRKAWSTPFRIMGEGILPQVAPMQIYYIIVKVVRVHLLNAPWRVPKEVEWLSVPYKRAGVLGIHPWMTAAPWT